MKIEHSELTRKALSNPESKEAFIRAVQGDQSQIIPIDGKKYRLVSSGALSSRTGIRPERDRP